MFASVPLLIAQTSERNNKRTRHRSASTVTNKAGVDEVLRVTTNLVTLAVSVRQRDGRYLFDLRREDFRIREEGVEQEIAHFSNVEQPFSVVMVIDTSASTQPNLEDIKEAATAFIDQLRPKDSVLPLAFDGQVRPLLNKGTSNRSNLSAAIDRLRADTGNNGTRLYDAVDYAYAALRGIDGRKAIILFTDGDDTWSKATMRSTLCASAELEALIYPIHYGSSPATNYLQALASESGGRFYQADSVENVKEAFVAVAEELRRQYSIGYYPKTTSPRPEERRVTVEVNQPDADVMTRKSYLYRP
jgi:Ca-activated chloride channel family protein